jgi:hypothetical protein
VNIFYQIIDFHQNSSRKVFRNGIGLPDAYSKNTFMELFATAIFYICGITFFYSV